MNHRRLSDISFVIDKELNVKDGNRSFLKLVQKTDFNVNISNILEDSDAKNLRYFLENFGDETPRRSFLANIKSLENYISTIFTITKEDEYFRVIIEELSYSRELLDKALLERREYSALMQNFDAYYFTFDGKQFILKNTKDLTTIFEGSKDVFKDYFSKTFQLNLHNEDTADQLHSMFDNIEAFVSNKYYSLLQVDKKILTVHTIKTSTRRKSSIVASINFTKNNVPLMNAYSESRDGLTGLYNKKAITELAIKKINEDKMPCSLIILDADKFKECNDSFGHIFGDKVLVTISSCINDAIKGRGIAGRIGGDEFLVLLDVTEEDDIRTIARNIRTEIQWNITNVEPESVVTCSMGIARFPLNAKSYEELFEIADKSLYIAKYRGRNCYILYKPEAHSKILIENKQADGRDASGQYFNECVEAELEICHQMGEIDTTKGQTVTRVLELIRKYLQISKITVYNKDLKLLYVVGEDDDDVRSAFMAQDKHYFKLLNKYDFLHLDNTNVLSSIDEERYELYHAADISSTIEYLVKDEAGANQLFVCYDLYRPARTFKKDKIIFALLMAKKLAQIL
ncbi:GGDEF domain-containing protein [uncultured Treponema sp.]|uniref:GGDEF domain-containing protein n=1 Tax=uncultured Treponema sp. TaxID=162155 RepID=UPI0025E1B816|nr:GGDEF domain-containing protein [uncultured Treponema sp.]